MQINPTHAEFGAIFDGRSVFVVPKYQRGYAWGDEAITDFLDDLTACFDIREVDGRSREHFFGGVLSVRRQMQGVANESKFELVDGQQRVTTLTLLAAALCEHYQSLYNSLNVAGDEYRERIELRRSRLKRCFIEYSQEVNREIRRVNVLTLSKNDEPFFRSMLANGGLRPSRNSHNKLVGAFARLRRYVSDLVATSELVEGKLDILERLQNVLLSDFSVLHMVTESRGDAYRLFQVINDRGVSLTDGDLLRARVLELLEDFDAEQDEVESMWDDILSDEPGVTFNYLHWIYESHAFSRARNSALADDFFVHFFPEVDYGRVTADHAIEILKAMRSIYNDILLCRKIIEGEWFFPEQRPVTPWERARLKTLVVDLGHTLCVPLLLAGSNLGHTDFRDIVLMLERGFFRFKVICGEHVTPLKSLYYAESRAIRTGGAAYDLDSLRTNLNALLNERAPINSFRDGLSSLTYQARSSGNKPIKYLLATIESYYEWFEQGATGTPSCIEGNRIYDFMATSIEHIYPRNAQADDRREGLEEFKNGIGNLTLLDPAPNSDSGNDPYAEKKAMYGRSSLHLNRFVAQYDDWGIAQLEAYKDRLLSMASAIFVA